MIGSGEGRGQRCQGNKRQRCAVVEGLPCTCDVNIPCDSSRLFSSTDSHLYMGQCRLLLGQCRLLNRSVSVTQPLSNPLLHYPLHSCVSGCSCDTVEVNAHIPERVSQVYLAGLVVSQAKECIIEIKVSLVGARPMGTGSGWQGFDRTTALLTVSNTSFQETFPRLAAPYHPTYQFC